MLDKTRCPICSRRLMPVTDAKGRTELRCLECDELDPLQTDAAKWAQCPLAPPTKGAPRS
jgi:tRNA(Ile2) C34 agmatinyltransferase TiaS